MTVIISSSIASGDASSGSAKKAVDALPELERS
jgi:hypothetical protein